MSKLPAGQPVIWPSRCSGLFVYMQICYACRCFLYVAIQNSLENLNPSKTKFQKQIRVFNIVHYFSKHLFCFHVVQMPKHLDRTKFSSWRSGCVSLYPLSFCQRLLESHHPSSKQMKCVISFEININAFSTLCGKEIRILNVQNPAAFNEKLQKLSHTQSLKRMESYLHIIKDLNNLSYFQT